VRAPFSRWCLAALYVLLLALGPALRPLDAPGARSGPPPCGQSLESGEADLDGKCGALGVPLLSALCASALCALDSGAAGCVGAAAGRLPACAGAHRVHSGLDPPSASDSQDA
jgi:hypothetical protein